MTTVQIKNSQGEVIAFVEGVGLAEAAREAWRLHPDAAAVELLVGAGRSTNASEAAVHAKFDALRLREDRGASVASVEAQLSSSFQRMGLSESSAKVAAAGRAGRHSGLPRSTVESKPAAASSQPTRLAEAFRKLGLPTDQAAIAAAGRRS